jgi:hypothetical protein
MERGEIRPGRHEGSRRPGGGVVGRRLHGSEKRAGEEETKAASCSYFFYDHIMHVVDWQDLFHDHIM